MSYKKAREIFYLMEKGDIAITTRDVRDSLLVLLSRSRKKLKECPKFVSKRQTDGTYHIQRV